MSNDLVKFFGTRDVSKQQDLQKNLRLFAANKAALSGERALLRLQKTGEWVFGIDNENLPDGSVLLADPASLQSGYVAWHKGTVEAEVMQPLSEGPVNAALLKPVQAKKGWETQVSVNLLLPQFEMQPVKLVYKTSSLGGLREMMRFAADIALALADNPHYAYPRIKCDVDTYEHKEYGTVFVPVLEILDWLDAEGAPVSAKPKLV